MKIYYKNASCLAAKDIYLISKVKLRTGSGDGFDEFHTISLNMSLSEMCRYRQVKNVYIILHNIYQKLRAMAVM